MDGLDGDADVTFLLTTNRVDALEPALAMRPGRVDHAVEVPLPDAEGRARLLELYRGDLDLDLANADSLIERTKGVTASFIKELIRRALLIALDESGGVGATGEVGESNSAAGVGGVAEAGSGVAVGPVDVVSERTDHAGGSVRVTAEHLDAALEILAGSRHQLTRRLLGAPETLPG